jgi:hypothetical protein
MVVFQFQDLWFFCFNSFKDQDILDMKIEKMKFLHIFYYKIFINSGLGLSYFILSYPTVESI